MDITMPQLGETVTEGTITRWFKQVGDTVAADEVLFEVSTDKVDSEVPSPAAGVLTEILVPEGETVAVGSVLARVGDAGASLAPAAAPVADAPDIESAAATPAPETVEPVAAPAPVAAAPPAEPVASPAQPAGPVPAGPSPQAGTPPTTGHPPASVEDAGGDSGAVADGGSDPRLLSPVVRRLIAEHGLDSGAIAGTGAGGRITRNDVQAVIEAGGGSPAPQAAPSAPAPDAPVAPSPAAPAPAPAAPPSAAPAAPVAAAPVAAAPAAAPAGRDEVVRFSRIRRRTAEHMVRSKATSPHALTAVEVDYGNVDAVRLVEKDSFRASEGVALTYLPFISRAVVDALREFPSLNASVGEDSLIVHHDVNLGYAVDLDFEGLMVPVVHNADGMRLRALARSVGEVADRARSGSLGPDDVMGGTFTITNLGSYGTTITFPVINQPQVAILSTDGIKKRPVVVELPDGSDAIVVRPTGWLAVAWDHRAVDGAYAAAFLRRVKEILETRDWSQELS
jgi:pyruvate dehydrogenase E2 component (dihydrolipoamide acetyltransferase)